MPGGKADDDVGLREECGRGLPRLMAGAGCAKFARGGNGIRLGPRASMAAGADGLCGWLQNPLVRRLHAGLQAEAPAYFANTA